MELNPIFSLSGRILVLPCNIVTQLAVSSYNQEIEFSLNLKKTGSDMVTKNHYFALLIPFLSLLTLSASSQRKTYTHLNFISRTFPVHTTSSQKGGFYPNKTLSDLSILNDVKSRKFVFDACGSSSSGNADVVTIPNGNNNVNPDSKVVNPSMAVDGDPATYSELNIMVKQKDVEVVQFVTFSATTSASDVVKLTLSLRSTLHNSEVWLQGYNGTSPVGTAVEINAQIPLITAGTKDFTLAPGAIFDRVRISVIAKDNGNDQALINLHEVSLTPPTAAPSTSGGSGSNNGGSSTISQCEGNVVLSVDNPISGYIYKWYDSSNTLQQESTSTTFTPAGLIASATPYVFYLSTSRALGCTIESPKHTINLTVEARPDTPNIQSN